MEVEEHEDALGFLDLVGQVLNQEYLWVEFSLRCQVLPIEIFPRSTRPRIAHDHAIRVSHGHNNKINPIPQLDSLLAAPTKKINEAFQHMRAIGLTRMRPADDQDVLLRLGGLMVADVQDWNVDTC